MAMSRAHVFQAISEKTAFVQHIDPPNPFTHEFIGRWEITPNLKDVLKHVVQKEANLGT